MARPLRFAPAGVPQHICCRGNQQQDVFVDDRDRRRYQELLIRHAAEWSVRILGYCQMTNHVHLVLQPNTDDGLSIMMERLNSDHARVFQGRAERTGHLWQHRFRSAAMDRSYLWTALRYVELNPVRAGMVGHAADWPWSSAAVHMGRAPWPDWLDRPIWRSGWDWTAWSDFLDQSMSDEELARIRRAARSNRTFAPIDVVRGWEIEHGIKLIPRKEGRPKSRPMGRAGAHLVAVPGVVGTGQG